MVTWSALTSSTLAVAPPYTIRGRSARSFARITVGAPGPPPRRTVHGPAYSPRMVPFYCTGAAAPRVEPRRAIGGAEPHNGISQAVA